MFNYDHVCSAVITYGQTMITYDRISWFSLILKISAVFVYFSNLNVDTIPNPVLYLYTNKKYHFKIMDPRISLLFLEEKGYLSIGCEPCTRKFDFENNRDGRWFGMKKTECGLHTDLAENK